MVIRSPTPYRMHNSERSPLPLDALWQARAILWAMLAGECLALVLALAPGTTGDRWMVFGLGSLAIQWVSLLTLGALYLLRNQLDRLPRQNVGWLAILLLLSNAWLVVGAARLLSGAAWPMQSAEWGELLLRVTGIVLAVGLLGLAALHNHWRGRMHAVRAKQAELQALQARIHPHFLFNTLNTGAALVHQRPGEAERLLLDLADLFRAALAGPREIPLAEELALAQRYLEIEALRFGDRLVVRWELPKDLPDVRVPSLSIQPLVENAIRHGVERMAHGDIEVTVSTTPDIVLVRISNPLPEDEHGVSHGHQVGLNASQVRIHALTGGRGRVHTGISDGRYIATVRLPIESGQATTR